MLTLRTARPEEAAICFSFLTDARLYQNALGFVQWSPEYPSTDTVADDIRRGEGFLFLLDGTPVGYCCIAIGDEPAYRDIDGAWQTERPYAVVHRLAFGDAGRGRGLSRSCFALIRDYCRQAGIRAIRADTQQENLPMQHIFEREGFVRCGTILFGGGPKLAYEWDEA